MLFFSYLFNEHMLSDFLKSYGNNREYTTLIVVMVAGVG